MKRLEIDFLDLPYSESTYSELATELAGLPWNTLEFANWSRAYPSETQANFQIAYQGSHLFIHYQVQEQYIKANYIRPNENVWEDSCVEFFLSLDAGKTYYNFEFNVLGTGLIGFGPSLKSDRQRLKDSEIQSVDTYTVVKNIQGKKEWRIILAIPLSLFGKEGHQLNGKIVHANFYKCGDKLPNPHFLSWNEVLSETPNFHLPEYFGEIQFK
ncbi:carbohydrate-binding family 9-like protein [Sphingobacterium sp. HJSM2_6]|uniref:carbohydrate-binding family 9-like protein n=1 Tax=Sphingobacterium sp. HJSM2_6 TaxID=3366264 RepID=UPI003BCDAD94